MKKRNNVKRFVILLLCAVISMSLMSLTVYADGDYIIIEGNEEKSRLEVFAARYDNYNIDAEKSIELWQTTSNTSLLDNAGYNLVAYCLPTYGGYSDDRKLVKLEIIVKSSKTAGGVEQDKEVRISDEENSVKAVIQEIGKHMLYFFNSNISITSIQWQVNPAADIEINASGYMELLEYAFKSKDNIYGLSSDESDASFFDASFILEAFGTDVALNEDTVLSATPQQVFNNVNLMNMMIWLDDEGRVLIHK